MEIGLGKRSGTMRKVATCRKNLSQLSQSMPRLKLSTTNININQVITHLQAKQPSKRTETGEQRTQ